MAHGIYGLAPSRQSNAMQSKAVGHHSQAKTARKLIGGNWTWAHVHKDDWCQPRHRSNQQNEEAIAAQEAFTFDWPAHNARRGLHVSQWAQKREYRQGERKSCDQCETRESTNCRREGRIILPGEKFVFGMPCHVSNRQNPPRQPNRTPAANNGGCRDTDKLYGNPIGPTI
ncbi:hypothetical protein VNO78_18057 [Psophocarpus tetragonolobus]|uniref:Uncharacterized protein n=1 Tax=Psophocarpus tetragonolobus TaxID=3891 RepID=A0AAN9SK82_PSOTE